MDFLELAKARYSCRMFSSKPVEEEKIDKILEAARLAPSAKNKQPCHVWIVRDRESLSRIDKATSCRYGAPLVMVVGFSRDIAWTREADGKCHGDIDATIMATHIMLEAAQLDVNSVWVDAFKPSVLGEQFPEFAGYEITCLMPMGYRTAIPVPSPNHLVRRKIEDFTTKI